MGADEQLYIRHRSSFYRFHDVEADGNCMYYCLAKCPATPLSSVDDIRLVLAKMMRKPSEHLLNFFVEYHKSDENPEPSLEKWQNTVLKNTEWGSNFESSLFGAIYGVDVRIITNSPSGLEQCDTRTLLEMYEVDSEKMIPKDAPTFYLYLHKHMHPHQPTKKPNHFAILEPIDYEPPEGSVIYSHPAEEPVDDSTSHSDSTRESLEFDGNTSITISRFDGNTSGSRHDGSCNSSNFDESYSSGKRSQQQKRRQSLRRPSEQQGAVPLMQARRNSLEMSALSNVLSEISTYDRLEPNRLHGASAKKSIQARRASMQDRKNWGSVMSEMGMYHSESILDLDNTRERREPSKPQQRMPSRDRISQRRSERSEAKVELREEGQRVQPSQRRAPQTGEPTNNGRRSRHERSSFGRRTVHPDRVSGVTPVSYPESNKESHSSHRDGQRSSVSKPKRPENGEVRHNSEGDRIDQMRDARRSYRSTTTREEGTQNEYWHSLASESMPGKPKTSNYRSTSDHTERSERTAVSSSSASRGQGGTRRKVADPVSHRIQDSLPSDIHGSLSKGTYRGGASANGAKARSVSRQATAPVNKDEESMASRGSQSVMNSRRPREEDNISSRVSRVIGRRFGEEESSKSFKPRAELDVQQHDRSQDTMRRRSDDALMYSSADLLGSTQGMMLSTGMDERPTRQRMAGHQGRSSSASMLTQQYDSPILNHMDPSSSRGRPDSIERNMRRLSCAPETVPPSRASITPSISPRRSSMAMQQDPRQRVRRFDDDRGRQDGTERNMRRLPCAPTTVLPSRTSRTPSISPRRSSMAMQQDPRQRARRFDDDRGRQDSKERNMRHLPYAPDTGPPSRASGMPSRSPRRSSMPVQQDPRQRTNSFDDDFYVDTSAGQRGSQYTDETRSKIESSRSQRSTESYASSQSGTRGRANVNDRQRRNSRRSMEMGAQPQARPEGRSTRYLETPETALPRSDNHAFRGTAAWAANIESPSNFNGNAMRQESSPDRQRKRTSRAPSHQPVARHFELYDSLE